MLRNKPKSSAYAIVEKLGRSEVLPVVNVAKFHSPKLKVEALSVKLLAVSTPKVPHPKLT